MTLIFELETDRSDIGKHHIIIEMRNNDGKVLNSFNIPKITNLKTPKGQSLGTAGFELKLHNTEFPKAGTYEIVILCDNEYLTSVDINLKLLNLKGR